MDKNEWLLTIALAPLFSPAAMAIEAYSRWWFVQELLSLRVHEDDQENDR
jgi:hypothetical protein